MACPFRSRGVRCRAEKSPAEAGLEETPFAASQERRKRKSAAAASARASRPSIGNESVGTTAVTCPTGVGVRVGVFDGVPVGVFVGVLVATATGVFVGVLVGVAVGVAVGVLVGCPWTMKQAENSDVSKGTLGTTPAGRARRTPGERPALGATSSVAVE